MFRPVLRLSSGNGLGTGRNIRHTIKCAILIIMNLCCVRLNTCRLSSKTHNGMASMVIDNRRPVEAGDIEGGAAH